ncbi:MAG: sialate O-acetylesterase [Coraliomargarita sp.]
MAEPSKEGMFRHYLVSILALVCFSLSLHAELRVPAIFTDHMVLQRDQHNPVWGWAKPGAEVTASIAEQTTKTTVDANGRWELQLPPLEVNQDGLVLEVKSGAESIRIADILVGEVWLCSGQSNMQWSVAQINDSDLEIATANYPQIRFISVPQVGTQELQDDFQGEWSVCSPETVVSFSAVGYFFGRQLHQTLDVPIGLIDNAWGGSAAEAWVARDVLESDGRFDAYLEQWKQTEATFDYAKELNKWQAAREKAKAAGKNAPRKPRNELAGQHRPGNLWAGVLNPIIGYGIRGTIWYQGESNAGRANQYHDLFSLMIQEWRKAWGQGDFPFYWVQLADFRDEVSTPAESSWAELREAQTMTLALPNTGQAVIYDVGEGRDIHPRDKQTVGKRLARIALARDYGQDFAYESPSYDSHEFKVGKAVLTFKDVGQGLYTFDVKHALGFSIAGEDRIWHKASATLKGKNQVVVSSPEVPNPVAVRYAWADNPVANLQSREGLPVVPFRTDDWPRLNEPK